MCGHESPSGSAFCLNCGSSLAPAFAQTPQQPSGLPTICGVCRGENPPGMKFCRNCGSALVGGPPSAVPVPPTIMSPGGGLPGMPPPGPIGGGGGYAPRGGGGMPPPGPLPLPPQGAFGPGVLNAGPVGPSLDVPPTVPPNQQPVPGNLGAGSKPGAQGGTITCPRCGTATPVGFAYCQQCGLHMQGLQPTDPGAATTPQRPRPLSAPPPVNAIGGPRASSPQPQQRPPTNQPVIDVQAATLAADGARAAAAMANPNAQRAPSQGAAWGTAVLVNRDGSDGQRFPLVGEYLMIGRAGADIEFAEDRFLARQHARLENAGGSVKVHPIDTLNGVFRKADAPVELADGMTILVGREVLRYERVESEEAKHHPLVRHGVALFGSPPREPWGRLLAIVPSGGYRDVRHLFDKEVVLGREEGDIVFRDDAFMSRRHAALTWDGKKAQITDLGSSNGTFVRLKGPTVLKHGDHVRMGDQLLRIELGR
ncbi:MAG TPA: FHA domain-containing protein [Kofleriaceae bacterium]|nr:FHA domain-containing protein [Kofleriaceae bacterium]